MTCCERLRGSREDVKGGVTDSLSLSCASGTVLGPLTWLLNECSPPRRGKDFGNPYCSWEYCEAYSWDWIPVCLTSYPSSWFFLERRLGGEHVCVLQARWNSEELLSSDSCLNYLWHCIPPLEWVMDCWQFPSEEAGAPVGGAALSLSKVWSMIETWILIITARLENI